MAIMMYQSFYNLNSEYINHMYQMKNVHYNLRYNYKFNIYWFFTKTYMVLTQFNILV